MGDWNWFRPLGFLVVEDDFFDPPECGCRVILAATLVTHPNRDIFENNEAFGMAECLASQSFLSDCSFAPFALVTVVAHILYAVMIKASLRSLNRTAVPTAVARSAPTPSIT